MDIDHALIRAIVSATAYAAAQAYARAGRVSDLRVDEANHTLTAEVRGAAARPYRQTIVLHRDKKQAWQVIGRCTCPVGRNCKHVAAALLAHLETARVHVPPPRAAALQSAQFRLAAPPDASAPANGLEPELAAWLRGLEADAAAEGEDDRSRSVQRLFYVLTPQVPAGRRAPALGVGLVAGDIRADGSAAPTLSRPRLDTLLHPVSQPPYVRPADRAILGQLHTLPLDGSGVDASAVLRQILDTGRARLGDYPGTAAVAGEARDGAVDWVMMADGAQLPVLEVAGGGKPVLLPAPWYLDRVSGEVGPITIDVPPKVLARMLNAPPVRPEHAAAVREALAQTLPRQSLPAPRALPHGGTVKGKPTPRLALRRLTLSSMPGMEHEFGYALADISFRYGPVLIRPNHIGTELVAGATLYTLVRHQAAERAALARMAKLNFIPLRQVLYSNAAPDDAHGYVHARGRVESKWLEFMANALPELRRAGWEVAIDEDFPYQFIEPTGDFDALLHEGSGIDWFDLDMGVLVGEERIDLLPPLLAVLKSPDADVILQKLRAAREDADGKMVLPLRDGRRLMLQTTLIGPVLLTLFDLFNAGGMTEQNGRVGVSRLGAADLAELEQAGLAANLVWRGGEAIRALGRQLRDRGCIPVVKVPGWFQADLRPYQRRGVDWLQFLREAGLGGVLADDMGLGKTVQALAHLAVEKAAGRLTAPALVICPTSVVGNWAREAARFVPDFKVLALQGTDRKARFPEIASSDLVISTYPLLARDAEVLTAQEWHALILDEAQTVKNPAASMAVTVRQISAGQRICLTGTPMENHLGELWALFDFMMPGFLGTQQQFGRRFRAPIEKNGDQMLHAALAKRVSPFLLRRNKADVAKDLPPRTDIVETVQMAPPQRAIYEAIRMAMHARVKQAIAEKGLAKSGILILDALLKMRQACCDPRLLKLPASSKKKAGSAKLERLLELLETLLEEGRAILLFSQFTSMLDLIADQLDAQGTAYVTLTGQTKDRRTPVDTFQAGKVKLFLISLKAGGVGLNLTAADTVIHYDPWWNPAAENQATDRAHRIGQTKNVFVHRLMTENSIEEKMEVLKARKSALAEGILSGAGASALKMTEGDVEMLFG
jgi:superfamily II DNA or RNA helicase